MLQFFCRAVAAAIFLCRAILLQSFLHGDSAAVFSAGQSCCNLSCSDTLCACCPAEVSCCICFMQVRCNILMQSIVIVSWMLAAPGCPATDSMVFETTQLNLLVEQTACHEPDSIKFLVLLLNSHQSLTYGCYNRAALQMPITSFATSLIAGHAGQHCMQEGMVVCAKSQSCVKVPQTAWIQC